MSGPATPSKRAETKAHNRSAILDAARGVFAELGYGEATIRDIIRRTDLASGTFYNYFPDKESVLRALVEESAQDFRRRVVAVRAEAESLERFLYDGYRAYFEFLLEDRPMFELVRRNVGTIRTLMEEPALGGGVAELLDDVRAAMARGDLPAVDADYLTGAMVGVALEIGVRMTERDDADVAAAATFATTLLLGGIERLSGAG